MPPWLRIAEESNRLFFDELIRTVEASGRYRPLVLDLQKLPLSSYDNARTFIEKSNVVFIVQHHSKFYSHGSRYARNVDFLEPYVSFVNSTQSQKIGHDKIATKKILREHGIPVLDDRLVTSVQDLEDHIAENTMYVIKPHNLGAGAGVNLIKKQHGQFFAYHDKRWRQISFAERSTSALRLKYRFDAAYPLHFFKKIRLDFTYAPMLVEPYFNDHEAGFSSLRCTVIGNQVVEAVKRTNVSNITSNISHGGKATVAMLSEQQKQAAIDVLRAIGADYAGVDFLIRGNDWVIGEVNIGPFTLFSKYTRVNVGKIFAEYLVEKCDTLRANYTSPRS